MTEKYSKDIISELEKSKREIKHKEKWRGDKTVRNRFRIILDETREAWDLLGMEPEQDDD